MQKEKKITINDTEYTCMELTAPQVRDVLEEAEKGDLHILDMLFPEQMPCIAVQKSTGKTLEELEQLLPSDYDALLKTVEIINPFFAALVVRILKTAGAVLSLKK
jgi:hypothetical protein